MRSMVRTSLCLFVYNMMMRMAGLCRSAAHGVLCQQNGVCCALIVRADSRGRQHTTLWQTAVPPQRRRCCRKFFMLICVLYVNDDAARLQLCASWGTGCCIIATYMLRAKRGVLVGKVV